MLLRKVEVSLHSDYDSADDKVRQCPCPSLVCFIDLKLLQTKRLLDYDYAIG